MVEAFDQIEGGLDAGGDQCLVQQLALARRHQQVGAAVEDQERRRVRRDVRDRVGRADQLGTGLPQPDAEQLGLGRVRHVVDHAALERTSPRVLTPGVTYAWTGKLEVPADDTYALWLQRTPRPPRAHSGARLSPGATRSNRSLGAGIKRRTAQPPGRGRSAGSVPAHI